MASTKLIVLKSKEIIYSVIFLALVALLIIILSIMFKKPGSGEISSSAKKENSDEAEASETSYIPGTYSENITLGESTVSVMVTVDEDSITDVALQNADETVSAMYPLLEPSVEDINTQLQYVASIDDVTFSGDNQYTASLICDAIKSALTKAVK